MPFGRNLRWFGQTFVDDIASMTPFNLDLTVLKVAISVLVCSDLRTTTLDIEPSAGADPVPPCEEFEHVFVPDSDLCPQYGACQAPNLVKEATHHVAGNVKPTFAGRIS
jgi:hypothetical protein